MARGISDKVHEGQEGCLEAVDHLIESSTSTQTGLQLSRVLNYLTSHNMKLLTSDKEGGFVVMSPLAFGERATTAILKTFGLSGNLSLRNTKAKTIELCERLICKALKPR